MPGQSADILPLLHRFIIPRAPECSPLGDPVPTHFQLEPNPIRHPEPVGPQPSHLALNADPSSLPRGCCLSAVR
ncbi:hypothetical protein PBY51_006018 [Eleginops maclovinus]|uniref:Uncharacterized protein n=1 Tax=Eleginops maclovinus TaxID=56733 RepID=A0AAN7WCX6_ELEMC|nr:hypothetical protein PBY51_006018 [Eleginops maclovinus]